MSLAIVATAGAATSNSFVTVDEADTYLEARLNASAWTDGDDDDKIRALIEATRELTLLEWDGTRTDTTQVLSWPRQYAHNPDIPAPIGLLAASQVYFDDDVIPQRVKDATCEYALAFLKAGTTDIASTDDALALKALTVGPIALDFASASQRVQGIGKYPRVVSLIAPLLSASGGLEVVRV